MTEPVSSSKQKTPALRVLFFCGPNAVVSFLAQTIFNHHVPTDYHAWSAAWDKSSMPEAMGTVLQRLGIKQVYGRPMASEELEKGLSFDLAISLCPPEDNCLLDPPNRKKKDTGHLVLDNPIRLKWPLDLPSDPSTLGEAELLAIGQCLYQRVEALIATDCLTAFTRHRQENNLLIDSLDLGILVHDQHRRVVRFNRAAEKITGLARGVVLGKDCHNLFSPGGFCGPKCHFCHGTTPLSKGDHCSYEILFDHPDHGPRRLKLSVTAIEIGDPKIPGVLVLFRDLTEITELRHQLNRENNFHGMAGLSPAMQDVFKTIRQVAFSSYPALITGESGTGKELAAKAIHAESSHKDGPFVPVNCAALPESILESELFGHVRGAFTGAIKDKKGRFELARGGTIFLDEIAELTPALQVKLLRVLQEKEFEPVGGEKTISTDARLISATNRDLTQMVAKGDFREDFYYRLRVVPIGLPPLRERADDLPLLVDQILSRIRDETGRGITGISPEAMIRFREYYWPGNVRELINALQFASISCTEENIKLQHLSPELRGAMEQLDHQEAKKPLLPAPELEKPGGHKNLTPETIRIALAKTGGNKARAAKLLGIGRATLYRHMQRLGR